MKEDCEDERRLRRKSLQEIHNLFETLISLVVHFSVPNLVLCISPSPFHGNQFLVSAYALVTSPLLEVSPKEMNECRMRHEKRM